MPIAVTLALLVFWLVMAYRQYQRGDMVLAESSRLLSR